MTVCFHAPAPAKAPGAWQIADADFHLLLQQERKSHGALKTAKLFPLGQPIQVHHRDTPTDDLRTQGIVS